MRAILVVTVAIIASSGAVAQPDNAPPPPPRYGISAALEVYPQATVKETLASVIKLADRGRYEYLAAHLLDPKAVDSRVADRARLLEATIEKELLIVRDEQRAGRLPVAERLPDDPAAFAAVVKADAKQRAFKLLAQDVKAVLTENPDHVQAFRLFLRNGKFIEGGDAASGILTEIKDRQVFFKKIDARWVIEDRQIEVDKK